MASYADKPIFHPRTVDQWESFLAGAPSADGVRLQLRKKASSAPGILYAEALDVALCFGWIDGQAGRLDDDYTLRVFTPRRARSVWSVVNREHVERLTAAGLMRPSGQAEVDRAKADGRWEAAYRQRDAEVPDDLQAALDASPAAGAFFGTLRKQERFAFLFRLGTLKRSETRERRIVEYIALLERGETLR